MQVTHSVDPIAAPTFAVSTTPAPTADDIRDSLITLINNDAIKITAIADGPAKIKLVHDEADSRGDVSILGNIAAEGWSVTGMAGAAAEAWSFDSLGSLWLQRLASVLPPPLDGAMMAREDLAQNIILFGGTADDAAQQLHFEWRWNPNG